MTTVFLGGGRITAAIIAGMRLAKYDHPIVVYDRNGHKRRALRRKFKVEVARDLKSAVERADMLIIAVRPASVADVLSEVARCRAVRRPTLAVSLAAGIPLKKLRAWLGAPVRWGRAMPSPACRIGRGLTAVAFSREVSARQRKQVRAFFAHGGRVLELPERRFDAFTASYSPSYGYHALATLAEAARKAGLDRKTALAAAAHALADGILYWQQSGRKLADLLDEASTPGGIAAATMSAMEEAGYHQAVAAGVRAGIRQARKNASQWTPFRPAKADPTPVTFVTIE
jgi:pyrroline-5-carboxylate reductase